MFQVIRAARAVAVTVRPGTDALAEIGPHVWAETVVHIHTGRPTRPEPAGEGARPIAGPVMGSRLIACTASASGEGRPPYPGGDRVRYWKRSRTQPAERPSQHH